MGIRIRPATALSVILAIAFALELIAVLSVPVTRSITLCTYQNIQFGVFGYCDTSTNTCSNIGIGYSDVASVEGFSLPSNARHTLANLLIVHVVAAGLTFILLILTLLAHFHAAAHSSKYLLTILILALPCFLLSLLAFLVDILLFVPHLDWGGWIVLAATVLIALFGVLLCIMRRTMSSRKAMKHRAYDNSELQNLNHFNNSSAYMPDGGIVYGGETVHKTPLNEFIELRYNTSAEDSVPLTHQPGDGTYVSNMSAGVNNTIPSSSQQPVSGPAAQYDNFRQHTPSPSREYRTLEYSEYTNYRTGHTTGYTPQVQQNYIVNSTPNYGEYPDYSRDSAYQGSSATAPAAVFAGSNPSVTLSQGPQRRPNMNGPVVPPAGTYEYYDGASLAPGSFQDFDVVPIPQLQNAAEQSQNLSGRLAEPQSAQPGYAHDSSSSAPSESGQSEYVQTKSNRRQESQIDRSLPQTQRYMQNQAKYLPQGQTHSPDPTRYPAEHIGNSSTSQASSQQESYGQIRYNLVNNQVEPSTVSEERFLEKQQQQQHTDSYSFPSLKSTETPEPSSPTISDSSHFTSISQRPVNPKYLQQSSVSALMAAERNDFVLSNNPDFQLPAPIGNRRGKSSKPAIPSPLASSGNSGSPQGPRNGNGLPPVSSIDRRERPYGAI